jgi:hypothetical protein
MKRKRKTSGVIGLVIVFSSLSAERERERERECGV